MACSYLASSSSVVAMTLDEKMERQDASIKKMAKALREGAKMLDLACPVCNNPIFQIKSGEKVCVSCERKVIFEGEETDKGMDHAIPTVPQGAQQHTLKKSMPVEASGEQQSIPAILSSLKARCTEKLASLVTKMERTTNEDELSVVYANILKIIDILKQISFL